MTIYWDDQLLESTKYRAFMLKSLFYIALLDSLSIKVVKSAFLNISQIGALLPNIKNLGIL